MRTPTKVSASRCWFPLVARRSLPPCRAVQDDVDGASKTLTIHLHIGVDTKLSSGEESSDEEDKDDVNNVATFTVLWDIKAGVMHGQKIPAVLLIAFEGVRVQIKNAPQVGRPAGGWRIAATLLPHCSRHRHHHRREPYASPRGLAHCYHIAPAAAATTAASLTPAPSGPRPAAPRRLLGGAATPQTGPLSGQQLRSDKLRGG